MCICLCNVHQHTNVASPTLLVELTGRAYAWSWGCLWCGTAVSRLVGVLP